MKPCPFCSGTSISVRVVDSEHASYYRGYAECNYCLARGTSFTSTEKHNLKFAAEYNWNNPKPVKSRPGFLNTLRAILFIASDP